MKFIKEMQAKYEEVNEKLLKEIEVRYDELTAVEGNEGGSFSHGGKG